MREMEIKTQMYQKKMNDIEKRVQKNHLIDFQSIDDDELSMP